jgi:LysM repeat protein
LERHPWIIGAFIFSSLLALYVLLKVFIIRPEQNLLAYQDNNNHSFNLIVPKKLDFCGEAIPTNNVKINRALAEEFYDNTYWKNNSAVLFQKAQRWFPIIEPILKQYGVPDDFKYLAVIESHLSNVSSPAGAAGFWQLVPVSAYNYGLEVNNLIDERYHVEKSTAAACQLITQAYAVFKNWTLAAAAYNFGINGIQKAVNCQKTDNYFELLLNDETGSYLYRLLAYKTLLSSPKHFGITKHRHTGSQRSLPFRSVKVDTTVAHLQYLAWHLGCTVKELRDFNPWLLKDELINPARKTYVFRLPLNSKIDYSGYLTDVVVGRTSFLSSAIIKSDTLAPVVLDTVPVEKSLIHYVVKINEPLKNLAKFFQVTEEDLRQWNNLKLGDMAVKGQTLVIYQ